MNPLQMTIRRESWPFDTPLAIAGYTFDSTDLIVVELGRDGVIGIGEACGVYYKGEAAEQMEYQLEAVRTVIERGVTGATLRELLPAGGARNALDCALWDLEAKAADKPVWSLAGLNPPQAVTTTFTCGADSPEQMAGRAKGYAQARALKLKLTGDPLDADRVRAVRAVRPEVWLGVDANQGFTIGSLRALMPILVESGVSLVEQPLPVGEDHQLDGFCSPIPLAADESLQSLGDLARLAGRYQYVNIKLDKCGGLTEALELADQARALGFGLMVGCMLGTSLSLAPAWLLAQLCEIADLDSPVLLGTDRRPGANFDNGQIVVPEALWGGSTRLDPASDHSECDKSTNG